MMLPYLLVAALALGGLGGWKVQAWRFAALEKERLEQEREDRARKEKTVDTAAVGHEKDKGRIRTEFVHITETVERIVREPFYAPDAAACLDPDGMLQLRAAIGIGDASGKPAGAVRGPDPASGRQSGGGPAVERGDGPPVPRVPVEAPPDR